MSLIGLGNRAIIGEFYKRLNRPAATWVDQVAMRIESDQASEEYKWLGMTPQMREWVGGRNAKGFRENGITIINKHYEATIDILVRELRRDKTGQAMTRIRELADGVRSHDTKLISTLIASGASATCYDGQFFFDTDHSEGDSGTQDNDLDIDISGLPAATAGVVTSPSVEEMQYSVMQAITQIMKFKDDQGEPMNENATSFVVYVPPGLSMAARQAFMVPKGVSVTQLDITSDFNITVAVDPRSAWTDSFAVFRADGNVKPFILQVEMDADLKVKGAGSEYEFDNDAHQYGVDSWKNVAFGYWQHACYVTMT